MNNPHTLFNTDFKPFTTTSGILSVKHMSDKQQDTYREQCVKYYAAQKDILAVTEPVGIISYEKCTNFDSFVPVILNKTNHVLDPLLYFDSYLEPEHMGNFSLVQDCKYPPSRLFASLIKRL